VVTSARTDQFKGEIIWCQNLKEGKIFPVNFSTKKSPASPSISYAELNQFFMLSFVELNLNFCCLVVLPDPQVKNKQSHMALSWLSVLSLPALPLEHFFIVYARSNVPGTVIVLNRSVLVLLIVI
jgi:hypothetical protein